MPVHEAGVPTCEASVSYLGEGTVRSLCSSWLRPWSGSSDVELALWAPVQGCLPPPKAAWG